MAIYEVQHIYHSVTGLPEDDIVNTLHFADGDGADVGTAATIAGFVASCFYDAVSSIGARLEGYLGPRVSRAILPDIKVYDAQEPGSPLAVAQQLAVRAPITATDLPAEVALCVSYRADYGTLLESAPDSEDPGLAPDRPRARVRNRMFLGPFCNDANSAGRPTVGVREAALDLIRLLNEGSEDLTDADCSFVVYSKTSDVAFDVTTAWADDAWDTQRRRGLSATGRITLAV